MPRGTDSLDWGAVWGTSLAGAHALAYVAYEDGHAAAAEQQADFLRRHLLG